MQKIVVQYDSDGNLVAVYNSVKEAASKNNISLDFLYKILRLEKRLYKGFIWLSTEEGKPVLKKISGISAKPVIDISLRKKLGLMDRKYPFEDMDLSDLEGEVWLPIPDYEEYFMVSNLGRIKRLPRWIYYNNGRKRFEAEKIVKQHIYQTKPNNDKPGLFSLAFCLHFDYHSQTKITSRIVYSAFIKKLKPIKDDHLLVLHYDLDGLNNRLENLYLATGNEFIKRNIEIGRRCDWSNKIASKTREETINRKRKPVSQFSREGQFIASFPSVREAAKQTGVNDKVIIDTAKGKQRHTKGFIWRYEKNEQS